MKNNITIILLFFLLFPLVVFADDSKLNIMSVKLVEKSSNATELKDAEIIDNKIKLNIKFYDIDDYAIYKVKLLNNSSIALEFDETSLLSNSEYVGYEIDYSDSSKRIEPSEEKEIAVKIYYKNEAPKVLFRSSIFDVSDSVTLGLIDKGISIPDTLRNVGLFGIFIYVLIIVNIVIGLVIIIKNKKISNINMLITFMLLIYLPKVTVANEIYEIPIDSNITIVNVKNNPCDFSEELTKGIEYRLSNNPQYVYKYKQEFDGTNWVDIDIDGWGVAIIDSDYSGEINEKLCSSIKDKPVVSMSNMFKNSKATKIDLSSFVTSEVINMSGMFDGLSSVDSLDLSKFNTEKVTNMSNMFRNCPNIQSLFLRHFVTSNVRNIDEIFSGDTNIKSINMDMWDISNISSNSNALNSTTSLESVSAREWIIPNEFHKWLDSNWGGMSSPIKSVDVTNWDLTNTTDLHSLFMNKSTIEEIKGLNTWDTSKLVNTAIMFSNCTSLKSIDLSSFDLSNVTNSIDMLNNVTGLVELITPKEYGSGIIILSKKMFDKDYKSYTSLNIDSPKKSKLELITFFDTGSNVRYKLNSLSGNVDNIEAFEREYDASKIPTSGTKIISDGYSKKQIIGWYENKTIYYYSEDDDIFFNPNSDYFFNYFTGIKSLDVSNIRADAIVTMRSMFYNLSKMTSLDVSNWNTSNVTDMNCAFENNSLLESLDLSSFDTSNVTNMAFIFANNKEMKLLDISSFDTSNVTDMSGMFSNITGLISLDLSHFNTSKVTNMSRMFEYDSDLRELNIINFDTSNVTDFSSMFSKCYMLRSLDLSNFDFSKYTQTSNSNYYTMFKNNFGLIELITPKNRPIEMDLNRILYDENDLEYSTIPAGSTSITLKAHKEATFDTGTKFQSNISSLKNYYSGVVEHIKRADSLPNHPIHTYYNSLYNIFSLSNSQYPIYGWYETSDKTIYYYSELDKIYMNQDAYQMFSYLEDVKTIDLTGIDTSKTTNMDYLFKSDPNLTELDVSNFDVRNVTTFYGAFKYLRSLRRLDLSSFETTSANKIAEMIGGCDNLEYLDISNFVLDNVYNDSAFLNGTNVKELKAPKSYGSTIISLPNTLYLEGGTPVTYLSSSLEPSVLLKDSPW